jgi:predicted AAA+ superfamily ATPase
VKRKITQALLEWKRSDRRKPLILDGARQTGKTYALHQFGRENYEDVAYFDLERSARVRAVFDGDIDSATVLMGLSLLHGRPIQAGKTLIVLDEVQASARALTSLKFFCEDAPEHHVIAAGSLLGIAVSRKKVSYPVGKVNLLTLYPMDFEEFLWSQGKDLLADAIREHYGTAKAFPLHDHAKELYRHYLVAGGMPEVLAHFADHGELLVLREIQDEILTSYIADITRYAEAAETVRILDAYNSLPAQLLRENRKFKYSSICSGARSSRFMYPLAWLEAARVTLRCNEAVAGTAPIIAHINPDAFKLYLSDVGLLCSRYEVSQADIVGESIASAAFRGALAENYVMQHLVAQGFTPAYWGRTGRAEVDFIITDKQGAAIPLEVKSAENVRSKSLGLFMEKYRAPYAVRVSGKNFGYENGIRSVPLYAAFCLDGL